MITHLNVVDYKYEGKDLKIIETEIQINANPQQVWEVLTDLGKYPEWNPFIKSVTGEITVGGKLEVVISPPNSKEMVFKPTVLSANPHSEFSWLGHLLLPGIFDGKHIFTIEGDENGTVLVQKEIFKGALVPLVWKSMEKNTKEGFELMNTALKQRVERG